jgi:iron(III) transport system permease protein
MGQTRSKLTFSLIIIVGVLTVGPIVMLLLGSFSKGLTAFGSFTLEKYIAAYTDPAFYEVIVNTIVFVLGSSTTATGIALFLAYLNNRTDIPMKFMFRIISIMPMMIPHLLFAVSWALLLNPSNGMMNIALMNIFGLENAPFNIYSLAGMIMVEGLPGFLERVPGGPSSG